MTDGVRPALAGHLAPHSSGARRPALADDHGQADFGHALLAPKKGEPQGPKEHRLDSEGPREKRWNRLAERLAARQPGEAVNKGEDVNAEDMLADVGDVVGPVEPPHDEIAAADASKPDAADATPLPVLLALSELRKAGTHPNAPAPSGDPDENAEMPVEASGAAPEQHPARAAAPARATSGEPADRDRMHAPAATDAPAKPSPAAQAPAGSAAGDAASVADRPSRPAPARQPEQAAAASRVTVISEQAIPAPAASGFAVTAGALANDIGAEAVRHAAAATAAQQLQAGASNGTAAHVLKIQLRPLELGMVTASLHLSGDQLSVEIQVENQEAYHRLSADRDTINNALRGLGFDVDRVTIQQPQIQANAQARNEGGSFSQGAGGREQSAFQSGGTGGEGGNSGNGRTSGRAANEDGNARNISSPGPASSGGSLYI